MHCRYGNVLWRAFHCRTMAGPGHTIRLMSPEYVKPYVKAPKRMTIEMLKRLPRQRHDRRCGLLPKKKHGSIFGHSTGCGPAGCERNIANQPPARDPFGARADLS